MRFCIEHKIPLYHAGQAAEMSKYHLGAEFTSIAILFRHRDPFFHRLLTALRHLLAYKPEMELPEVVLKNGPVSGDRP